MKTPDTSPFSPIAPPADGGNPATVSGEQKSRFTEPLLERSVMLGLGIEDPRQIRTTVARRIYVIDALGSCSDLGLRDREALLAFGLWTAANGKYADVESFLGLSRRDAKGAIDPVMESEGLQVAYQKGERALSLLKRVTPKGGIEESKLKPTIVLVVEFIGQGLEDREIIQRLK